MNEVNPKPTSAHIDAEAPPRVSAMEGWTLHEYQVVNSTNLVAANLGAWTAARADTQTAGRGRFQRGWVSDVGGLWLSAVVPCDTKSPAGRTLPLAAGVAVCDALRSLGPEQVRLRWPNDVLVGDRKLAGLLVDQFTPGLAVIGIGLNVVNLPESRDAALKGLTARLADLVPVTPSIHELAALLLWNLRRVLAGSAAVNLQHLLPRLNELWGQPRHVELDLDGELRRGVFQGVDEDGRLILLEAPGNRASYEPWQVRHLKEIS